MKQRVPKWFDRAFVATMVIVTIASIVAIARGIKDDSERREQIEYNIDSLREAHRKLSRPRIDPREKDLKTRDDSIHLYEDGF